MRNKHSLFLMLAMLVGILSFTVACGGGGNPAAPNPGPTSTPLPDPTTVTVKVPTHIDLAQVQAMMARSANVNIRPSCRNMAVEFVGDIGMTDRLRTAIAGWGVNPDAGTCAILRFTVTAEVEAERAGPSVAADGVTVAVANVYINPVSVRNGEFLLAHGMGHALFDLTHASGSDYIMNSLPQALVANATEQWLAEVHWAYAPGTKFKFER